LLVTSAFPARAAVVADAPAAPKTIALIRLSFSPGDKAIEDLVKAALRDTGRLSPQAAMAGADFVGRLQITRESGATDLDLAVSTRAGAPVVDAHQSVLLDHSLVNAVKALAAQVVFALDGGRGSSPPSNSSADPMAQTSPDSSIRPATAGRVSERKRERDSDATVPIKEEEAPPDDDDYRRRFDIIAGAEFGFGPWSADPGKIISGSPNGFDFTNYAPAFTKSIDGQWHPALALHAGWKFLGYGAFELAYQGSRWASSGAATLWGVRFSAFPLSALWPAHKLDLGIELGGGYSFVAGGSYDMSGTYFTFGLTCEYPINKLIGVVAYYRLFTPFLKNFYIDYNSGFSEPVSGFTAIWNTFGIGLNFHPTIRW
jgi:hypothetical protein